MTETLLLSVEVDIIAKIPFLGKQHFKRRRIFLRRGLRIS